jgi:hypothetical protein
MAAVDFRPAVAAIATMPAGRTASKKRIFLDFRSAGADWPRREGPERGAVVLHAPV